MVDIVELPSRLAILPFRNRVLLPGAIVRIRCTSPTSVKLVEQELWQREEKGLIGVLPVRDTQATETPPASTVSPPAGLTDLGERKGKGTPGSSPDFHQQIVKHPQDFVHWHKRGVAARALHLSRGMEKPSGRVTYTVVLEGLCRFSVQEMNAKGAYNIARVSPLDMTRTEMEQAEEDPEVLVLSRQFKVIAAELISVLEQKQKTVGRTKVLLETVPVHRLADIFVASFEVSFEEQLAMLDAVDLKVRLTKATELVNSHLQTIRVAEKISQKVEGQLSKSQKEFLLRQQMRAIKEELGDNDDDEDDMVALERKMQSAGMPANVWKHAQRELRRLRKMQPQQPGYSSSRVYLELLADLPWQISSEEHELDLRAAKERLDSEHYGLGKVKKRIIEYLAVRKLKPDARGPVLCFVGPPGVGKTSLASSIAGALDRRFIRISLGGVKDEADIRGHRRTYIGSMPGRLIEGLKRVGVNNPVMLLDEVDKTGSDVRGDPASALLEVLDPEQNKTFNDHYLNVPFDLSKVVFVATANRVQPIPPPLLDRMEVIELPGYTPEEKLRIAMRHLIPRVLEHITSSTADPDKCTKSVLKETGTLWYRSKATAKICPKSNEQSKRTNDDEKKENVTSKEQGIYKKDNLRVHMEDIVRDTLEKVLTNLSAHDDQEEDALNSEKNENREDCSDSFLDSFSFSGPIHCQEYDIPMLSVDPELQRNEECSDNRKKPSKETHKKPLHTKIFNPSSWKKRKNDGMDQTADCAKKDKYKLYQKVQSCPPSPQKVSRLSQASSSSSLGKKSKITPIQPFRFRTMERGILREREYNKKIGRSCASSDNVFASPESKLYLSDVFWFLKRCALINECINCFFNKIQSRIVQLKAGMVVHQFL